MWLPNRLGPSNLEHGAEYYVPAVLARAQALNSLLLAPIGVLPAALGDPMRPFQVGPWQGVWRCCLKLFLRFVAHDGCTPGMPGAGPVIDRE